MERTGRETKKTVREKIQIQGSSASEECTERDDERSEKGEIINRERRLLHEDSQRKESVGEAQESSEEEYAYKRFSGLQTLSIRVIYLFSTPLSLLRNYKRKKLKIIF